MDYDIEIALIMAGGKGKRFGSSMKPFVEICGKPMIFNIINKTRKIFKFTIIAVSANVESFLHILKNKYKDVMLIYTTGIDYSIDIGIILDIIKERPIMIFPSDMPNITEETIKYVIKSTEDIKEDIITITDIHGNPIGISIVKGYNLKKWTNFALDNKNILNINTVEDFEKAKMMCND
ncbi:MAG: hypothetical protein C0171_03450 [Caldisphaera sp.]|uniref:NTP transferase domain-containing protein n=1 Tax=Caldisphaera sp. TaxID=2060322 RepID=UPI000CBA1AA0|nr:MAG: hypothetical protein C0202_01390 [Caldisphaera sp.]PMP91129.1 MAG: hypothetical protein C0171_03450 [Caldisphaera sp.]